jgi:uncharacterized integral membrane protein
MPVQKGGEWDKVSRRIGSLPVRQVNFVVIFAISLILVLFSLQNIEPATIKLYQGASITAPLAVELILAMGLGAVFAWVFSVWVGVQRVIESRQEQEKLQTQEVQIQELQQDIARYRAEVEVQQKLLPSSDES